MMAANRVSSGTSYVPPPFGRTFDGMLSGFAAPLIWGFCGGWR